MTNRAPISVRIHDAHIGIWQDDAQDPSFRSEVYGGLIRKMRARGWSITRDSRVHKHHRSISPNHREGARGTLRCAIGLCGRSLEVDFWSVSAPQVNRNGRRYDYDRMRRMSHIDNLRVELEFKRITRWLKDFASVSVSRTGNDGLTPIQIIEKTYAECWHTDKKLGRPICQYDYNRKAHGGALLEHGQTVWIADRSGRALRGKAFYNINNMWWVIAGGQLFNKSAGELDVTQPENLRRKHNERRRRTRLEEELAKAVTRTDYLRADLLKRILFGTEQTYVIWARDKEAYYRAQYSGYTMDRIKAGKYTRAEAEAECRRVPHELEMVCPDGSHVRFDRNAA